MAECNWCNKDMNDLDIITCEGNKKVPYPDGTTLDAIPYRQNGMPEDHRCHDCNVKQNSYHHPGCDMERCPKCHGQLISCGCLDEMEIEEE